MKNLAHGELSSFVGYGPDLKSCGLLNFIIVPRFSVVACRVFLRPFHRGRIYQLNLGPQLDFSRLGF